MESMFYANDAEFGISFRVPKEKNGYNNNNTTFGHGDHDEYFFKRRRGKLI